MLGVSLLPFRISYCRISYFLGVRFYIFFVLFWWLLGAPLLLIRISYLLVVGFYIFWFSFDSCWVQHYWLLGFLIYRDFFIVGFLIYWDFFILGFLIIRIYYCWVSFWWPMEVLIVECNIATCWDFLLWDFLLLGFLIDGFSFDGYWDFLFIGLSFDGQWIFLLLGAASLLDGISTLWVIFNSILVSTEYGSCHVVVGYIEVARLDDDELTLNIS